MSGIRARFGRISSVMKIPGAGFLKGLGRSRDGTQIRLTSYAACAG